MMNVTTQIVRNHKRTESRSKRTHKSKTFERIKKKQIKTLKNSYKSKVLTKHFFDEQNPKIQKIKNSNGVL